MEHRLIRRFPGHEKYPEHQSERIGKAGAFTNIEQWPVAEDAKTEAELREETRRRVLKNLDEPSQN